MIKSRKSTQIIQESSQLCNTFVPVFQSMRVRVKYKTKFFKHDKYGNL